ncbi:hypothetical protein ABIA69_003928 [Lysinibacillus parviboronicapiens]|uniref:KilA-N DNA-binding domain-containing protein n=1 Tax=Lysinibacillus parviboronicapiens TaxID=436516 RepID=A0ABV2PP71_9BACI
MNQLQFIVHDNRSVLTTAQIAESYEIDKDRISANYKENEKRFKEGKHFILLQGDALKDFKNNKPRNSGLVWTEKGAWLHAKSLNTDRAWEAYEMLVDEYYNVKENVVLLSKDQALVTVLCTTADLVEDTQAIKEEQHEIRKEL